MAVDQLPPGFVLDELEEETGLPPGFVLDEERPAVKGIFGTVPAESFARGERNIAGNLIERPAAATRGAIRANPLLALLGPAAGVPAALGFGGLAAQERARAASLDPSRERSFQEEEIERFYANVAQRQPGREATFPQTIGGLVPSAMGLAKDVIVSPVDALLTVLGVSPAGRRAGQAIAASKPGQAVGQLLRKPRRSPLEILQGIFRTKPSLSEAELVTMGEERLAKLPQLARQTARQLRTQQVSQVLASDRQALQIQYQHTLDTIRAEKIRLGRSAPSVAAKRLETLEEPFRKLQKKQNIAYSEGMNARLADAEQPSGQPIAFTREEINEAIANQYLKPQVAGESPLVLEDPTEYRELLSLFSGEDFVNQQEISARSILNKIESLSQSIGRAAKEKLRPFTPSEVKAQHLRDLLIDLLDQQGIDISSVKNDWKTWVPLRNLGLKLQTPAGPRQLISIVRGQDPVRAKSLEHLEALLGENLDKETKAVFSQLDALNQQKVLKNATLSEQRRLLSERGGAERKSLTMQKYHVENQALHRARVRKAIFIAGGLLVSQTPVGKTILRTAREVLLPE